MVLAKEHHRNWFGLDRDPRTKTDPFGAGCNSSVLELSITMTKYLDYIRPGSNKILKISGLFGLIS